MSRSDLLSVEAALAKVLAGVGQPLETERIAIMRALGRTLAENIDARRTQPPFANSAMDGYALRSADTVKSPTRLKIIGESAAGHAFAGALNAGEALRIFTGAPLPDGADAVLIQEEAQREGDRLIVSAPQAAARNIRNAGIDFIEGERLLAKGRRLGARDLALAAAGDHADVAAFRRPRVAVLATGDEIVMPGAARGAAQIVASNNFAIAGIVEASGGEVIDLGVAPDESAALARSFRRAREQRADVMVTLGGASVGDYDLVRQALLEAGLALGFWRIAMRPGKPLMHGRLGAMHVLGLPGNPVSAIVCAALFLRPLLRALQGDPDAGADVSEAATLGADLAANDQRQDYLRAILTRTDGGLPIATPSAAQDSSLVKILAQADALLIRPPNAPSAKRGEPCRIMRLREIGI